MKINLKRPHRFFGIYHLTSLLKYVGCTEVFCDRLGDKITNKHIIEFFQRIDKFRERKNVIIIEDFDVWDVDYTLSLIILPLLKRFKESKRFGIPMLEEFDNLSEEERQKAWEDILDKMIWSFENILNEDYKQFYDSEHDYSKFKDLDSFIENINNSTNNFNKEKYEEYHKKIQEGLNLFGKHFRQLWD